MSAHYSFHNRRHHEHIRWLKRTLVGFGFLGLGVSIWLVNSYLITPTGDTGPISSAPRSRSQQPTTEVFRTPYFQFQAGNEWAEDATVSGNGTYVYRAYQGSLIQQDITIYVNPTIAPPLVTRVQPVVIGENGILVSDKPISEHCSAVVPEGMKKPMPVTYQNVSFICHSDGTIFGVLVGEEKGTGLLTMPRPAGGTVSFIIVYRDLTAQPVGRDLEEIINTFQSR